MSDSLRHREKCAECRQWREDCGEGQVCRACRLEGEVAGLRVELAAEQCNVEEARRDLALLSEQVDAARAANELLAARLTETEECRQQLAAEAATALADQMQALDQRDEARALARCRDEELGAREADIADLVREREETKAHAAELFDRMREARDLARRLLGIAPLDGSTQQQLAEKHPWLKG